MTIHKFQELKNLALERQKHYMQLTGQLDSNGKMLVNVNFVRHTEIKEMVEFVNCEFDIECGLNEVFDNKLARLQYDENGKVILDMREFLEDGTKNPKFGKVKKKNITPNLKQFFRQ